MSPIRTAAAWIWSLDMVSTGWPLARPIDPVDILSVPQPLTPSASAINTAVAESPLLTRTRLARIDVTPFPFRPQTALFPVREIFC